MSESIAPLTLEIEEAVGHIRFRRPRALNAMDVAMARALRDAVRDLAAASGVRAIVISGEGHAFMAGGDLRAFHANLANAPALACDIINPLHEAVAQLAQHSAPVVASVHGAVAGAGFSLMLGCDFVVASGDTRFVPAYAQIGASADAGGSWALAQLVGVRRAMELLMLGDVLDAKAALEHGLVNRIVPAGQLSSETLELARRLAQGPTYALGHIKRLLRAALHRPLQAQLDAERFAFADCAASLDFAEGVSAFIEKRPARFQGR